MPALAPLDNPLETDGPPPLPVGVGVGLGVDCVLKLDGVVVVIPDPVFWPSRDRSLLCHITMSGTASIAFDDARVVVERKVEDAVAGLPVATLSTFVKTAPE